MSADKITFESDTQREWSIVCAGKSIGVIQPQLNGNFNPTRNYEIVVTDNRNFAQPGNFIYSSIKEAKEVARQIRRI